MYKYLLDQFRSVYGKGKKKRKAPPITGYGGP